MDNGVRNLTDIDRPVWESQAFAQAPRYAMTYDDDKELTQYVLEHFEHLMTEFVLPRG